MFRVSLSDEVREGRLLGSRFRHAGGATGLDAAQEPGQVLGELVYEVVAASIRQLLNPDLTASWEKGLTYVAEGSITPDEYMEKLERFVAGRTGSVMRLNNQYQLRDSFAAAARYYKR